MGHISEPAITSNFESLRDVFPFRVEPLEKLGAPSPANLTNFPARTDFVAYPVESGMHEKVFEKIRFLYPEMPKLIPVCHFTPDLESVPPGYEPYVTAAVHDFDSKLQIWMIAFVRENMVDGFPMSDVIYLRKDGIPFHMITAAVSASPPEITIDESFSWPVFDTKVITPTQSGLTYYQFNVACEQKPFQRVVSTLVRDAEKLAMKVHEAQHGADKIITGTYEYYPFPKFEPLVLQESPNSEPRTPAMSIVSYLQGQPVVTPARYATDRECRL